MTSATGSFSKKHPFIFKGADTNHILYFLLLFFVPLDFSRDNGLSVLLLMGSFHHQGHCLHYASIYFHIPISYHVVDMKEIKYHWVALA